MRTQQTSIGCNSDGVPVYFALSRGW